MLISLPSLELRPPLGRRGSGSETSDVVSDGQPWKTKEPRRHPGSIRGDWA